MNTPKEEAINSAGNLGQVGRLGLRMETAAAGFSVTPDRNPG